MTSKSSDLLVNSFSIMINNETDYQPLVVNEDIISDNEYEPGNLFLNFLLINKLVVRLKPIC